jgi:hypothetical protein
MLAMIAVRDSAVTGCPSARRHVDLITDDSLQRGDRIAMYKHDRTFNAMSFRLFVLHLLQLRIQAALVH